MANLHRGTPIKLAPKVMRADMVKVDPKGKYLLHINFGPVPQQHRRELMEVFEANLREWYNSDRPIFSIFTWGQPLTLYRIDEVEEGSEDE